MTERYSTTAIVLHWAIALLIFAAFPLGLYLEDMKPSPTTLKLYSYHKSMGVSVFFLLALRLGWRATHPPPLQPAGMPRWQVIASAAIHHSLYLLMAAIPLSGWLASSAKGFPTVWLGLVQLPDLLGRNKELGELLGGVHGTLNGIMLLLVVLHVAAALKHHFIDKDGLLLRMSPFPARKQKA